MTQYSLIAAIDEADGIGLNNQLLCYLPTDLRRFKQITLGKPIIMGRKTHESIGKILPNRTNIIISRTKTSVDGAIVVSSLKAALDRTANESEVIFIGGEQLFRETIKIATRIYLTRIHYRFKADVFFPHIDASEWTPKTIEFYPKDKDNSYDTSFYVYERP